MMNRIVRIICLLFIFCLVTFANTPGKHTVLLTWIASSTSGVTYNIYRGTTAGVCNGTPTPYVTGITLTSYTDTNVQVGTYFYNVSAVSTIGDESICAGEVQCRVFQLIHLHHCLVHSNNIK